MKKWYGAGLIAAVIIIAMYLALPRGQTENDNTGKPPRAVQQIVALSPSNAEILYALGLEERIVGVAGASDYPPQARDKPQVGPYNEPDVERIIALQPDIVVAAGEIQAPCIRLLRQAGIPVISVEPQSMGEILTAIRDIAAATGSEAAGESLCENLTGKLVRVQQLTADCRPKRVFLEIWENPLLTAGGRSYLNDLLRQAGGSNVAGMRNGNYISWDLEDMYAADPEVYLLLGHKKQQQAVAKLAARPELAQLSAVRQGRVYVIHDNLWVRVGPRSFDGLLEAAGYLQSEVMKGVNKLE